MKAAVLLRELFPTHTIPDLEITNVTESSANADRHSIFVCICGAHTDGHGFASKAYANGCRLFVAQKELALPDGAAVLICPDTRKALAHLACRMYGEPSHQMRLIGITGTKGKTTVALLLSHILDRVGIPCGYIGTNGIHYANTRLETRNTTPDARTLQRTLCEMRKVGVNTAVVEVSSQALMQKRVDGTRFDAAIFTNLFPDHISPIEHPDFEHYKACKHRLFTDFGVQTVVYHADDSAATEMLADTCAVHRISCSTKQGDYTAQNVRLLRDDKTLGVAFEICHGGVCVPCSLPLTGLVNAENALLAVAVATEVFGIPLQAAAASLADATVAGRSELIALPHGASAVIDYAHNGESLAQLLSTLREYRPNRLIVLFGSIGERAQMRRHELGVVAATLADLAILTSDNPANEPPEQIIADIAAAFVGSQTPFLTVPDRAEAIRTAVRLIQAGDILVLAGKGHETYQLVGDCKLPFSEREILNEALAEKTFS